MNLKLSDIKFWKKKRCKYVFRKAIGSGDLTRTCVSFDTDRHRFIQYEGHTPIIRNATQVQILVLFDGDV